MLLDSVRPTDRVLGYWALIIVNMIINVELGEGLSFETPLSLVLETLTLLPFNVWNSWH